MIHVRSACQLVPQGNLELGYDLLIASCGICMDDETIHVAVGL